jgi:hypothetical protein
MTTLTYSQLKAKAAEYRKTGNAIRMQTSIRLDWSEARMASICGTPYIALNIDDDLHLVDQNKRQYYGNYHVFKDGKFVGSAEIHEIHSSNRWS